MRFQISSLGNSGRLLLSSTPSRFREGVRMLSVRPKLSFQKSMLNLFVVPC
jgi:hypothetical protein